MQISIGRLRGGFCVYWTENGTRKRHQLKACTRAEAESEARDVYTRHRTPAGELTVSQIWELYRDYLGSKTTAETMKYTGKSILLSFGEMRPEQITIEDCRTYRRKRLASGRKDGTVWSELMHLRSSLNWAFKTNVIARKVYIEIPPKPESRIEPISDIDLAKIVDNCIAPHVRLAVILLLSTGGRAGAIVDLTWDRIDFDRGIIDLRPKDGESRKGRAAVPMNRISRSALETAYNARLSDYVIEYGGEAIKSFKTGYSAAIRRAGLKDINIHQIRHTVAIKLLTKGRSLAEVSDYLGHSNPVITKKLYAKFQPEHMKNSAEILELDSLKPRAV